MRAERLVAGFEMLFEKLLPTTGLRGQAELSALVPGNGAGDEFAAMILDETVRKEKEYLRFVPFAEQ